MMIEDFDESFLSPEVRPSFLVFPEVASDVQIATPFVQPSYKNIKR